ETDDPIDRQWMYGIIGAWRKWSDIVTFQPYYLNLRQDQITTAQTRNIHSPGIRAYGVIPGTAYDFDLSATYQFGSDGGRDHRALGTVAEVGYTFAHDWKPRLSANYGYASGDRRPNDRKNERFERFFGFSRPWSNNDYFQFENVHAPKARIEITPSKDLRADAGVSAYWLASKTDRWNAVNLRDATGSRGSYLGDEIDGRIRYKLHPLVDSTVGYAWFNPGKFTRLSGRGQDTHFLYIELTFRAFE
ncbi:MAG: alginate export family protein, partial [Proteobacteria bacterium]|nr:alginate export family protein [Pseudomonadota bacterium]